MKRVAEKPMQTREMEPPRVFISYSHDSTEQLNRVLSLADRLRAEGIDCHIDQYEMAPPERWPRWMINQIEASDYVLVVCTETYNLRFAGKSPPGSGRGAKWEGTIITQEFYDAEFITTKFIPILFSTEDSKHIPIVLRGTNYYNVSDENGYENLYRLLTNQPRVTKPSLGKRRPMPPLNREAFDVESDTSYPEGHRTLTSRRTGVITPSHIEVGQSTGLTQDLNARDRGRNSRFKASALSGLLLLAFIFYTFIFVPDSLPDFKLRMLAIACALTTGLFGYFLTGAVRLTLDPSRSKFRWVYIQATGGFTAAALMLIWWLSPWAPIKSEKSSAESIAIFRVRIAVLDTQQKPVDDVIIRSSLGGELKKVSGGWELNVPAANKLANGNLVIYASGQNASLQGQADLTLNGDPNPSVTIWMERSESPLESNSVQAGSTQPPERSTSPQPIPNQRASVNPEDVTPYRVRITVTDPQQKPVKDVVILSSLEGELKKTAVGWELVIPAANKPADGNLTIYASELGGFRREQSTLRLGKDKSPSISIQLGGSTPARVFGRVIDEENREAISGAQVSVAGHDSETVLTGAKGDFNLASHATEGQMVRLRVEKEGYITKEQLHPAGSIHVTIILRRR